MTKQRKVSLKIAKRFLYEDFTSRVKWQNISGACALCGSKDNITVHHWCVADHFAGQARYLYANGIPLCYACHIRKVHTRADYATIQDVARAALHVPKDVIIGASNSAREDIAKIMAAASKPVTDAWIREEWAKRRSDTTIRDYDQLFEFKKSVARASVPYKRVFTCCLIRQCWIDTEQKQDFPDAPLVRGRLIRLGKKYAKALGFSVDEYPFLEILAVQEVKRSEPLKIRAYGFREDSTLLVTPVASAKQSAV